MLAITAATVVDGCIPLNGGSAAMIGDALRITPRPHARQVRARFTCQNIGSHTLRVVALAPADPHTRATCDMQFIGPGRQVCVDIVVDVSQPPGRVAPQVDVVTQGPARRRLALKLIIESPEQLSDRFTGPSPQHLVRRRSPSRDASPAVSKALF